MVVPPAIPGDRGAAPLPGVEERGARALGLLGAAFDAVLIADATLSIVEVEGDPAGLLGRTAAELIGAPLSSLVSEGTAVLPMRRAPELFADTAPGVAVERFDVRHAGGALVPVEVIFVPLGGTPRRVAALIRGARHLEGMAAAVCRSARTRRVLAAVHEALEGVEDEGTAFRNVCHALVAEGGYPLAWIGLAEPDARRSVRAAARAGPDLGYVAGLSLVWADTEEGQGPVGTAIRLGETVAVPCYRRAPGARAWSEADGTPPYAGAVALPLRIDGAVVGALSLEARDADAFPPREIELLELTVDRLGRACSLIRARAARRHAEARLAEVLDAMDIVAWSARDADGRLTYLNAAAERVLGRPRAELLRTPALLRAVAHPDDAAAVERSVATRLSRGTSDTEYRIVRPDGTVRWLQLTVRAARDAAGAVVGRDGIAIDVTARREAELALRDLNAELERRVAERTAELQDLYDNAPCGYHSLAPDGTILRINETELRWLGYRREELLGRKIWELLTPASRAVGIRDMAAQSAGTGDAFGDVEREFVRRDGSTFWVLLSAALVRDAEGRLLRTGATLVDMTEHRRAERLLGEQEARVRDVLEHSGDLVSVTDAEHHLTYVNPAWQAALGYTAEEARALTILDIVDPADRPATEAGVRADMRDRSTAPHRVARRLVAKGGKRISVEGNVGARFEGDRFAGVQAFFTDITERRAAEEALRTSRDELHASNEALRAANEALRTAGKSKDEFLASMSHELRTPLNGVLGLGEALQEEVYGPVNERQRLALRRIDDSGRHLLSLITDILDVAKVEAGKLTLELTPVNPVELVEASLAIVHPSAQRKSLSLVKRLGFEPGLFLLDERRMKQVLVNLLSNAVKFTPEGGEVGIAAHHDGGSLCFAVWDTGIGIAPGEVARLFQPFVQLDSSLSRRHNGTGLGLVLVRRFVELHGGSVHLSSEPGQGSRFTVQVPLHQAPASRR
jgi:PAS domain S-box-containing protein